jgi:hypothetical protein
LIGASVGICYIWDMQIAPASHVTRLEQAVASFARPRNAAGAGVAIALIFFAIGFTAAELGRTGGVCTGIYSPARTTVVT